MAETREVLAGGVTYEQDLDGAGEPVGDLRDAEFMAGAAARLAQLRPASLRTRVVERPVVDDAGLLVGTVRYEQDVDESGAPTGDLRELRERLE